MTDKMPSERFMRSLLADTFMTNSVHLTLSGRNDNPVGYRAVYADGAQIGVVFRKYGQTWSAEDLQGRLHGDSYTTDWNAAKQLALSLGTRTAGILMRSYNGELHT